MDDDKIVSFTQEIDTVITKYQEDFSAAGISGILLSRVTLLMSHDTEVGKGLLKYVWEKLDELEQSNPGQYL
jgi:hypothetical protein